MPQDVDFFMPFPPRVAPRLEARLDRHLAWAREHGLIRSETAADHYLATGHVDAGAWFCPAPKDDAELDLHLDTIGWIFVHDDVWDIPSGQPNNTGELIVHHLMALLADTARHADPVAHLAGESDQSPVGPTISGFANIWRRTRNMTSAAWQQRASCTWTDYLTAGLAEEANRRAGVWPTPSEHLTIRRDSVGVMPLIDMRETAGPYEVPALAWHSTFLRKMRELMVDQVVFVNEVHSLEKDEARGDVNLVSILCTADDNGIAECPSREAALQRVIAAADERIQRFQEYETRVEPFLDHLGMVGADRTAVTRHVTSMRDMIAGNYFWSRGCGRYGAFGNTNTTPDRTGLLAQIDFSEAIS